VLCLLMTFSLCTGKLSAAAMNGDDAPPPEPASTNAPVQKLYIKEFRVLGAHQILGREDIEKAVYPYMGPERTPDDVEQARAALEKAFQDKGYQTVSVQIPQQTGKRGIVFLQVIEERVGRLNVEGSRYFSLDAIKKKVPSLAPGTVPNFNQVTKEIMSLNQWSDRQVTPTLSPGFEPGTVDVNLNVKDTFPWHGSAEFNNRYSPNTVPYRINLASSYDDLWQLGHSIGGSFQIAPQEPSEALNWNVFYTARFPKLDWLKLNLSYSQQNSTVSTLGGSAVNGAGQTAAFRFLFALPAEKEFNQSLSAGIDFKHLNQAINESVVIPGVASLPPTPLNYWPIRINYNAIWLPKDSTTIFNAGLSFGVRGAILPVPGTSYGNEGDFSNLRYDSDGGFIVFKADLSHTHELPGGFQFFGKVQGQLSPNPLVYSEQFSAGGLDTVRGYLEGTEAGDNAVFGTVELRSPSLLAGHLSLNEWRVYAFYDAGRVTINEPLAGQTSEWNMTSYGAGTRVRLCNDLNGSLDLGIPLITQDPVTAYSLLATFRIFGEF